MNRTSQGIQRAIISVTDKTGVVEFAKQLFGEGVEILSTGGTAKVLREAGVPVTDVATYTGSPEVMDGRVKTLHPRVFGGILMRGEDDLPDLDKLGGKPIDLVVVNLYQFEKTVAKEGVTLDEAVENIDIGGPSLIRAAAKNHKRVTVVTSPADYLGVIVELRVNGDTTLETRQRLMVKAFVTTAAYDAAITGYFGKKYGY